MKLGNYELLQALEFSRHIYKNKICENEHSFNLEKIRLALKLIGYETNMSEFENALKKQKKNQMNRLKKKKFQLQMKVMKNLELAKDEKINFVVDMDDFKKTMEEFTSKKQSKKKEKLNVLSLKNLEKFEKRESWLDLAEKTKLAEMPIAQI